MICCKHCGKQFQPSRKTQSYCSSQRCQRKRKSVWQRQKLSDDSDYREAQREAQKRWRKKHPDYWKNYRQRNPSYTIRNRRSQRERNSKRRSQDTSESPPIAKMDARPSLLSGTYCIIPFTMESREVIAKMDVRPELVTIQPVIENKDDCKERIYNGGG